MGNVYFKVSSLPEYLLFQPSCPKGVLHLSIFVFYLKFIKTFFWKIMYESYSKLAKELKNDINI